MIHRCDIQRDTGLAQQDEWGGPTSPDWHTILPGTSCYFWYLPASGSRSIIDGARQVQLTVPMLVLPLGTPITDDDRLLSIKDRRGRLIQDGPLFITEIGAREDCLELKLAVTQ